MLLPFLDLKFEKYKISSCLVRILIDLAVDHQREDTRHLNFPHTDLNLWWVQKKVDLWYCHISILIKNNHSFITWIIYVISFIRHFVRHPIQMNVENMLWKKCCKKYWNSKTPHVLVLNMSFCLSYHKTILFSAPKQRKCKIRMVIVLSKWRDIKMMSPPPIFQTQYHFSFFLSPILIF